MEVKSINVNTVFDKKTVKDNLNKPLYTISGFVDEAFFTNTKFGEQIGFKGDFVAVNLLNGEIFESVAAFVPKGLGTQLERMIKDNPNTSVEINATVMAIPSDKNDKGYAWVAEKPMTEERLKRRAALLENANTASKKLLAAPKKAAKEEKAA